ncbi:MAG: hypothetical protein IT533_14985 [Hyphomicrobiales bacterium]|nr:hypothetical protein [Hyphomicrobiales bacterium]MCO5081221.1 hypothetical protein [Rhizobiaceae bacterium]
MRALTAIAAFLAGLAVGYVLSIGAYIVLTEFGIVFDRDGGIGMGFAFFIGPLVAIAFGVAGVILVLRRKRTEQPR